MALEIGFHVMAEKSDAFDKYGTFEDQMSIVEFLRRVDRMDDLPMDVSVWGFDDYLREVEGPERMCEEVHEILRDRVTFLLNHQPIIQFVVEDVEYWDGPVIPDGDDKIDLDIVFHGLEQNGPGWYSKNLNVTS